MGNVREVSIPVDELSAAALERAETREMIGHLVDRVLRREKVEELFQAIGRLKADAQARGMTDRLIDEELEAYNAERRTMSPPVG